jgi:hypothetical protein
MPWTDVTKPSSTTYTGVYFPGKEIYDDSTIAYDSSATYYDTTAAGQYTQILTPKVGWNLNYASVVSRVECPEDAKNAVWMFIRPDGKKLYFGTFGDEEDTHDVLEYSITSAWDLDTITYVGEKTLAYHFAGGFLGDDGKSLYLISGLQNYEGVWRYQLSSAWDITSAVFQSLFPASPGLSSWDGIYFSLDGSRMFLALKTGEVKEYDLEVPWNTLTSRERNTFDFSSIADPFEGFFFSPDGKDLFILGIVGGDTKIFHYFLPNAWSLTGASKKESLQIPGTEPEAIAFALDTAGTKVVVDVDGESELWTYNLEDTWSKVSKPT